MAAFMGILFPRPSVQAPWQSLLQVTLALQVDCVEAGGYITEARVGCATVSSGCTYVQFTARGCAPQVFEGGWYRRMHLCHAVCASHTVVSLEGVLEPQLSIVVSVRLSDAVMKRVAEVPEGLLTLSPEIMTAAVSLNTQKPSAAQSVRAAMCQPATAMPPAVMITPPAPCYAHMDVLQINVRGGLSFDLPVVRGGLSCMRIVYRPSPAAAPDLMASQAWMHNFEDLLQRAYPWHRRPQNVVMRQGLATPAARTLPIEELPPNYQVLVQFVRNALVYAHKAALPVHVLVVHTIPGTTSMWNAGFSVLTVVRWREDDSHHLCIVVLQPEPGTALLDSTPQQLLAVVLQELPAQWALVLGALDASWLDVPVDSALRAVFSKRARKVCSVVTTDHEVPQKLLRVRPMNA
jgi:hypothetical protein